MPAVFRKSFLLLSALAFGLIAKAPVPLAMAEQEGWRPEPPGEVELAELEELARWVDPSDEEAQTTEGRLPQGLRQAISERRSSFRVFRRFNDGKAHRKFLAEVPFGQDIYETAQSHEIDPLLFAALVEAESNFSPNVISPVGAIGLAQVMPTTASTYSPEEIAHPRTNLELGAGYLKEQLERFGGNLELAVAAYNAGPYAVVRYDGIPPYRETRNYVEKVLAIYVSHHRSLWRGSAFSDLLQQD